MSEAGYATAGARGKKGHQSSMGSDRRGRSERRARSKDVGAPPPGCGAREEGHAIPRIVDVKELPQKETSAVKTCVAYFDRPNTVPILITRTDTRKKWGLAQTGSGRLELLETTWDRFGGSRDGSHD